MSNKIEISKRYFAELVEDQKRATHLQKDLGMVDELHYDFCVKLHEEIAMLKRKLKIRGVN